MLDYDNCNFPMTQFREYLASRQLGPATVQSYVHWVRSIYRSLHKPPDAHFTVEELLAYDIELETKYRSLFRSAWRQFAAFHEAKGLQISCPAFPRRQGWAREEKSRVVHPMQAVIATLIKQGLKPKMLARLTWRAAMLINGQVRVSDPVKHWAAFMSIEDMRALRQWAVPATPDSPLIPESPRSVHPLSEGKIRIAAKPILGLLA